MTTQVRFVCTIWLSLLPSFAWASDPTPLFVLFVAIPSILVSIAILVICFVLPRLGVFSSCVALLVNLLIAGWAGEVGYLDGEGSFFLSSLIINIAGIVVAINKLQARKAEEQDGKAGDMGTTVSIELKDYIPVDVFAKDKHLEADKVIAMIKGGFYIGRYAEGKWYVHKQEQ